ncbi:MAG: aldolase/citrate lyase family protein [Propionibacteriaceae bacterium]
MDDLRAVMARGRPVVNGWLSVDSIYLAEVLSLSGFDCITVDVQHGMFDLSAAIRLLQGVGLGTAVPMARTTRLEASVIGKLLDAGAQAIICPTLDTAAEAAEFVSMCRYPPEGVRSFGPARANLRADPEYLAHARPMTWAMIESAPAMDNLDAIVAVDGLDALYVGPNDLALALGAAPGTVEPPPVVIEAMQRIVAAAHGAGLYVGSFCSTGAVARQMVELGFDLVTPGNDTSILRTAAGREIALARGEAHPSTNVAGY